MAETLFHTLEESGKTEEISSGFFFWGFVGLSRE